MWQAVEGKELFRPTGRPAIAGPEEFSKNRQWSRSRQHRNPAGQLLTWAAASLLLGKSALARLSLMSAYVRW